MIAEGVYGKENKEATVHPIGFYLSAKGVVLFLQGAWAGMVLRLRGLSSLSNAHTQSLCGSPDSSLDSGMAWLGAF